MESFVPCRGLLSSFKVSTFDQDAAVSHLAYAHQEVLRLDFATNHLWIIVDFDLFRENAALLVFLLDELISNLDCIYQGLVLADDLWFVLLQGHHDRFMCNFVRFDLR